MILKALEMQGFKSFPDKTVLEFNKGITAVVGPNGSGKSNISDAVRWVLGEQSTKTLRGSKMEDVIFSGTDVRKAKGFAEVTLRLDNTDRSLNKDSDEVSVTRRYYRSGDSEYLVNGESARLRDVNELFMDTGLGRDGYSIVGQGKIADMVSPKASERRDMLEEAAGISHFRYRRGDAIKRLAQAEENLVRLRDILSELESRVGPLKAQSEKAQKFIVLAGERKNLEIGIWLNTIDKTGEKMRDQEHKIEIAEASHKEAQDELSKIGEMIDKAADGTRDINIKLEEIRNSASGFEEKLSDIDSQIKVAENSILHNNETIERINRDKAAENETEQNIDAAVSAARECIQKAEEQIADATRQMDELSKQEETYRLSSSEFSDRAAALSGEISALSVRLADCRVTAETANSSIEEIRSRISAIDESMGTRKDDYDALLKRKADAEASLKEIQDEIVSVKNAIDGYTLRFENRGKKADSVKLAIDEKQRELHKGQDRVRLLEDLEKNMEGYFGAVKAVMKESGRGALRGIYGPVSQLITVKDKYSAAIETALGAAVQNIVVDNETDAKRAMGFLKEHRAGRATFLPITAIKGRVLSEQGLDDQYGFVSIASDLVSYDNKYSEIIRWLLGRTAVAEDIDSAIAIAKKYSYRFRIVTLDGQVINAGGSMTGGSRVQNAGILSRGNEIERLKGSLASMQKELDGMLSDYKLLLEDASAAKAELEGAEGDLLRAKEENIRREGELKLASDKLASVSSGVKELLEEKETLEKRIESVSSGAEAARSQIDELKETLENKEKELESITGDSKTLQKNREEVASKAAEIRLRIVSLQKDVEANTDEITRLKNRKTGHLDRLSELDEEIREIEEKNDELRALTERLSADEKALKANHGDAQNQINELISQRDELEKQANDLRLHERAKSEERERLSGDIARLEERKIAMRNEYDNLTSKLYDEYQLTRREAAALEIEIDDYSLAAKRLAELKSQIRALGSVNVSAIEEYKEVSERYEFLSGQINDVETSRAELNKMIDDLTGKMAEQFREQFNRINSCFGQTFIELFGGGKAELRLEDERDVLGSDIEIKVQPPGKNVQNINLLSGGEKGLSAIALLFAILKVTPAPFCIFDEVEAALDDVNVSRYAQYVRRMTKNTQFILITHRRGTMEEADVLYGVTMQEKGVSKLLELKTAEMAKKLGLA
ncbi:MAG TPA: chromosome segregation protein SMC [Ruminococcaceae bacterium]|nr:chromosome segregation protein SMC [Oscillospiraceae bacterium]